jgi:hypothetical protein
MTSTHPLDEEVYIPHPDTVETPIRGEFINYCAQENLPRVISFLQEFRHEISQPCLNYALGVVSCTNNIQLVQYLIDQGSNVDDAFCSACNNDSTDDTINYLMEIGGFDLESQNIYMKRAINMDEAHTINRLIEAGFNDWSSALYDAVSLQKINSIHLFLSHYHPTPDELQELGKLLEDDPNPEILQILCNIGL